MFRQSSERIQMQCAKYIDDGDTKTFKVLLLGHNPYSDDLKLMKKSFITRSRRLKIARKCTVLWAHRVGANGAKTELRKRSRNSSCTATS